jgi:hypothetical protein
VQDDVEAHIEILGDVEKNRKIPQRETQARVALRLVV